jgi:hypothetical protein
VSFDFGAGFFSVGGFSLGTLAGEAFSEGELGGRDERVAGAEPCPREPPANNAKQKIAPAAASFLIRLHGPAF